DRNLQLAAELEQLLLSAGSAAQRQPGAIDAGNRAVEQAHAQVLQTQLELLVFGALELAEVELGGIDLELWFLDVAGGELCEELSETAVLIGILCCLARGHSKVGAADAAEEFFQGALFDQVEGLGPILLAGHRQLVEVTTLGPGREHKRLAESLLGNR